MQLALDSLDRLVDHVEEAGGLVAATEAAATVFAVPAVSDELACALLRPLVEEDARLAWRGRHIALAGADDPLLEQARFVVFDLETTGLAVASARICEIGAVRIEGLEQVASFQTLVAPGVPLPVAIGRLTNIAERDLRRAPRVAAALARFRAFAGDAVLAAHNARFDVGFVDRELRRSTGKRLSATVVDTVPLARNLLRGRVDRTSLRELARFFGTSVEPCHRALPDAQATAEVLLALIGLAQERGARTVANLVELSVPRPRRVHGKRRLAHGAPTAPGVYLWRDGHDQVLYVGKARDLRARLRSYFRSARQRPTLEAALGAVERIEWHVLGSELAAALEEARLIRELRPAANARRPEPERYVYLRYERERVVVSRLASQHGPLRRRSHAERAARALAGCSREEFDRLLDGAVQRRLGIRLGELADSLRYEEAARLRDRIASLERVVAHLGRLERLRRLELCLLVPAVQPGWREAFFVAGGRIVCRRMLPPGGGAELELAAGTAVARAAARGEPSRAAEHLDELLIVGSFLAKPPPELCVLPLTSGRPDQTRSSLTSCSQIGCLGPHGYVSAEAA